MPARQLTSKGKVIFSVAWVPCFIYFMWDRFANGPASAWLDRQQANVFGGRFWPKFSLALTLFGSMLVVLALVRLIEFAFGMHENETGEA